MTASERSNKEEQTSWDSVCFFTCQTFLWLFCQEKVTPHRQPKGQRSRVTQQTNKHFRDGDNGRGGGGGGGREEKLSVFLPETRAHLKLISKLLTYLNLLFFSGFLASCLHPEQQQEQTDGCNTLPQTNRNTDTVKPDPSGSSKTTGSPVANWKPTRTVENTGYLHKGLQNALACMHLLVTTHFDAHIINIMQPYRSNFYYMNENGLFNV